MIRVLLPLWLTIMLFAGPPQEKAAASPVPAPIPFAQDQVKTRMQTSLDKQRASVRKQVSDYISIGESQPSDSFLLPWPKPPAPATNMSFIQPISLAVEPPPPWASCEPLPEPELQWIVQQASERQKISPKLIRAMITQESGGRACAVSTAGAQGLMQLMPEVQRELSVDDPFDARQSVEAGAKLLRSLIDRYAGNVPKALAAYNAGPGAVDRAGGIPPIRETTNYVKKIVQRIE